jgi:hypothetical protein
MPLRHQGVWVVGIIAAHDHVDYNRSAFFLVRKASPLVAKYRTVNHPKLL